MGHKGHYGQYTGNAKWSRNHADTKVTKENYKASERDDAAHIDYLKRDVDYDNKHGHSDENMTADEKHISKLAGDMKYDKEHHGSPAKKAASSGRSGHPRHMQSGADNSGNPNAASPDEYWRKHQQSRHHRSAPKETEEAPSRKASPLNGFNNYTSDTHKHPHAKGTSRKSSPANNISYGDISGKTGYMGEAKYDMEYNAVDDITQGKGKADYGVSRKYKCKQ